MSEYFITARSFAAPFVSDESTHFIEANSPEEALTKFAEGYSHPFGLIAKKQAAGGSYYGHGPGKFDGESYSIPDPKGGHVV